MAEPPRGYPPPAPGARFTDPADPLISDDLTGWVQRAVALVRGYWRPLLTIQLVGAAVALVVRVPAAVARTAATTGLPAINPIDSPAARDLARRALPGLGVGFAGTLVGSLVLGLALLAGMRLLVVAVTGGPVSVRDALRDTVGRLPPLAGWSSLAGLLVLAGICACVLPGLYLATVFSVLPAVVLFERGGVIVRCFRLFHADAGTALARVAGTAAVVIVAALVSSIVTTVADALSRGAPVVGTVVATTVGVLVDAAAGVVVTPMVLTTYADQRARREPLDAAVLAHELTGL